MTNNTVYDIGEANQYVKWAFSRLRYVPSTIKDMIKQDGIWLDLVQELYAVGYDSWIHNLTLQQTRNYAQRRIRLFFKHYGYREHHFTLFRQEIPFALFSARCHDNDVAEYILDNPRPAYLPDSVTLRHMEERVLSLLKRHPAGVNRYIMSKRLGVDLKEAQRCLDKLVEENKIARVEREVYHGSRITPLYFIAGYAIPQGSIRTEVNEAIRYAYFVERKTRYQIQKETGRNYYTILRAIAAAPPELMVMT